MSNVRIAFSMIIGEWFVVRGPHQTIISGPFRTREEARAWRERNK